MAGRPVEARWINDPVRLGWVLVKRHRPSASQVLALRPNDIRRHAHSDGIVIPEVDKAKVRGGRDLRITALGQLRLIDRKIADQAFAAVAENNFEKAYFQGVAEIENAEAVGSNAAPRIAEPARRFSARQRIRIGAPVDPTERPTPRYGLYFELCAREIGWRWNARHSVEIAPGHTFSRSQHRSVIALLKGTKTRPPIERAMR